MKLVPYDVEKLGNLCGRKFRCNQNIVYEFFQSDLKCAKVEGMNAKNAHIAQNMLCRACKRLNLDKSITAISRKGEVFLVKKI